MQWNRIRLHPLQFSTRIPTTTVLSMHVWWRRQQWYQVFKRTSFKQPIYSYMSSEHCRFKTVSDYSTACVVEVSQACRRGTQVQQDRHMTRTKIRSQKVYWYHINIRKYYLHQSEDRTCDRLNLVRVTPVLEGLVSQNGDIRRHAPVSCTWHHSNKATISKWSKS